MAFTVSGLRDGAQGARPIPPGSFHIIAPQLPSVGRNWRSEHAPWGI